MKQYNKDAYSTKNIFTKEYSTNGIMVKCHLMPLNDIDCFVLDFIIKKVPDYITYTVCEERRYFELYIPAKFIKGNKYNLESLMGCTEISYIIRKIKGIRSKREIKTEFYCQAGFKLRSNQFLNKLKNI